MKSHPNDRQLQQFLNKRCSEQEFHGLRKHIRSCAECRDRLHAFLDMEALLDRMPVLAAPDSMEGRIMGAIASEQEETRIHSLIGQRMTAPSRPRGHMELMHGLVATAATFIFVTSGILGKILSIDANHWGADVQN